jgi:hypothetical protein
MPLFPIPIKFTPEIPRHRKLAFKKEGVLQRNLQSKLKIILKSLIRTVKYLGPQAGTGSVKLGVIRYGLE